MFDSNQIFDTSHQNVMRTSRIFTQKIDGILLMNDALNHSHIFRNDYSRFAVI